MGYLSRWISCKHTVIHTVAKQQEFKESLQRYNIYIVWGQPNKLSDGDTFLYPPTVNIFSFMHKKIDIVYGKLT